ncbi:AAA family ATPase [Nocardioides sp. AX2bis]|uniref:AAA family ATPase n=1 Tax=Nocardioides sp. AX2bis TaxID=2653157 RepID=UPI0012F243EA|nr:AAA family ATPase [Nocardioides sp. AX2bis]VXB33135.1 Adenylate cyclase [Nocardioides sp. AX2bis]
MDATAMAPVRCFTHDLFADGATLVQDATTMAVDLAGFTSLTDRLSAWGSRGTEQLSQVLRSYFEGVTDLVVAAGGDVVAFGGDSLSILLDGPPAPTLRAALGVATRIQELTAATQAVPVPDGVTTLGVRVGVARGTVATAVARSGGRLLPVHVGPGLDLAHAAQESAGTGSVAVDGSAVPRSSGAGGTAPRQRSVPVSVPVPWSTGRVPVALRGDVDGLLPSALLERLHRGREPEESHRTVTVAFVRYPPVDPADLRPFLDRVGSLLDLVLASGGEVVQVSGGDKGVLAMVVLGAPVAHPDDPVRAVHAMVELRRLEPRVAVGIATGPVFAAVLGSTTRLFPTHTGLAVNVAARLAQHAGDGCVLVDDRTWEGAARHLRLDGRPRRLSVRGCDAPVLVRGVAGRRRAPARPASAAVPLLVGRRSELARVEQLLDAVATGRGGVLTLHGPPGIGASRICREAVEGARTRGFGTVCVDVADHPRGRAPGVWREVVGALLGVPARAARRVWLDALAVALPDVPDLVVVLGPLLGLGDGPSRRSLDPGVEQLAAELARTALGRLLVHGAGREPVLLVVEHADRLDGTSADLLRHLGAAASRCAAGVVLTWGPEGGPGRTAPPAGAVVLAPLGPDDTGLLAEEAWRRAGGGTPPSWLAGLVVPYAGGHPVVAQAAVHDLLARWRPGEPPPAPGALAGPATALVSSQVDRLPVDAVELLTVLAVAQRPCAPQVLVDLLPTGHDLNSVRRTASALEDEHLVTHGDGSEETYRIPHELARRVVYDRASHAVRERLHRSLVERLASTGADPVEAAEHAHALADPALGRRWFPLAAQAARDGWDLDGALGWLERLRPLVHGAERERVELEELEVLLVAGRAVDVLERLEPPAAAGPTSRDRSLLARRLLVLAEAAYGCGRPERTEEVAAEVMRLVGTTDEPRYQRAGELLTLARCHRGDLEGALVSGRALVARAASGEDAAVRATASAALAVVLVLSGRPGDAEGHYRAALAAATEAGDVVRQVHVLSDLAGCAYLQGRQEACVELMTQARGRAETIGYQRHLALSLNNEAQLRVALGDRYGPACASASVQRSLELGDLAQAADALQSWLGATPALKADAGLWGRLVQVDLRLGRSLEAAAGRAELAVVLARSGRYAAARRAATEADGDDPAHNPDDVRRRAALARLLADAGDGAGGDGDHVRTGLDLLADDPDLEPRERAEIALEQWRLTRTPGSRAAAAASVGEAYAAEPSAVVRSWLRLLREPVPAATDRLPPPVGITRVRSGRRELEQAFADVEAAVAAAAPPVVEE